MAKPRMDLSAFVGKLLEEQDGDVLREGIRVLSQALMETEVAVLIGADRHVGRDQVCELILRWDRRALDPLDRQRETAAPRWRHGSKRRCRPTDCPDTGPLDRQTHGKRQFGPHERPSTAQHAQSF